MDNIIVIGAGPVGLAFASSLANTNLKVTLIEKAPLNSLEKPSPDGRDIALTHLSKKILAGLYIWNDFPTNDISIIKGAKVLDGGSNYSLNFDNSQESPLGFLVPNYIIRKALYEKVSKLENVEIKTEQSVTETKVFDSKVDVSLANGETLSGKLLIAADGRFSRTRTNMGISADSHDFGRAVILARMKHEFSNKGIAYECFLYGQTLAVLPISEYESSIVITVTTNRQLDFLTMPNEEFNLNVQNNFKNKLGKMEVIGKRNSYPLVAVYANKFVSHRFALLGDAAVGMHPVTAHGFNLGLRGQNVLAKHIKNCLNSKIDFGQEYILKKYQFEHRKASKPIYIGTNAIVKLYTSELNVSKIARQAILRFANNIAPIKNKIMDQLTEIRY